MPVHVQAVDERQRVGAEQVRKQRELAALEVHDHRHVVGRPHVQRQPGRQVQGLNSRPAVGERRMTRSR